MSTTTRFLGNCPVCEGDFKLHKGKLVHHGYQRPGDGMIHGDCFCVGMDPYEVSPKGCELFRTFLQGMLANLQEALVRFTSGEVTELSKLVFRGAWRDHELVKVSKAENPAEFARLLQDKIHETESRIRGTEREIARMNARIEAWKPMPIRTVEEEQAKKTAETEARKAAKAAERADKRQARIASFQKRIDSAMKNKNASALASIWEKVNGDLYYELKLSSKEEAVKVIDRDHVWALFGLTPGGSWKAQDEVYKSNAAITQKMRWEEKFWPEAK